MLADAGDVGRLAALAADPARHHRMLEATGGDAAALAEIAAAHALISTSPSPDLLAALRLARHRDQLTNRNAHIPPSCLRSGQPSGSPSAPKPSPGPSPTRNTRRRPWRDVAAAAAAPATVTAPGSWPPTPSRSPGPSPTRTSRRGPWPAWPRRQPAAATAIAPKPSPGPSPTRMTRRRPWPAWLRRQPAAGDYDRARELAADAEQTARSITDPDQRAWALAGVAGAAAGGRRLRPRRGPRPVHHQPGLAGARPGRRGRGAWPAAGDCDRAEALARSITSPDLRACGPGRRGRGGSRRRRLRPR